MKNEELKKKIADIIFHTGCTGACCECDYSKVSDADTYCKALLKADALIAAGLRFGENLTAIFDHMALKREHELERRLAEAEHRAEVLERALRYACWDLTQCYGEKVRQEWADLKAAQYKNKADAEERKDEER